MTTHLSYCASRCLRIECDRHAVNAPEEGFVSYALLHTTCPDYQPAPVEEEAPE